MNNTNNTTHTINGLRLVSPEEAGKSHRGKTGSIIKAVILLDGHPKWAISTTDTMYFEAELVDLPKPRTTRPYKRGEVKCGDVFRHKETGNDYMVIGIYRNDQVWFLNEHKTYTYATLLEHWQKLTYDSEGREVLSEAGVETDA